MATFSTSNTCHMWRISDFSTCREIFNFPTIVIHGKLKFLHMTIFSPLIILVISVTNIRSVYCEVTICLLVFLTNSHWLKVWSQNIKIIVSFVKQWKLISMSNLCLLNHQEFKNDQIYRACNLNWTMKLLCIIEQWNVSKVWQIKTWVFNNNALPLLALYRKRNRAIWL